MKIVILGGVAAGAKAAAKARRLLPDANIELYTDDTHISYSACGLPYFIEGNFEDYKLLLVRSPEEFEKKNVHIHLKNRAVKIIPEAKQVLIQDLETQRANLVEYDKLIIATGARPIIPKIKNVSLPNVFTLRKIEDGIAIKEKLLKSKHGTIVGGGYIGIELLEALVKQNIKATLVEYSPHVMPIFDEDMSQLIENQLSSINNGRFEIILCAGVKPNVEIAKDAGIELGVTGAIKVNEKMETSIPDIYACGDCVEENLVISNTKIWLPLGSNANKEGRTAAINACGGEDKFLGVLGSAVTRCLNLTMSMTGLTEKKASALGYSPVTATVTKNDKVGYMPDVNNITLKLIADYDSGKLLGAQAIGAGDADKRINALAAALLAAMTVEEFYNNDLTYAPPFSPTIDPLLNAAQILINKVKPKD